MSLQACSNVTLDDVAVLGESCPYGRDLSLNLLVLVYVSGAVSDYALMKQNYIYTLAHTHTHTRTHARTHARTHTQSIFSIQWPSLCMVNVCNIHQKDNTHAIYYTQIVRVHSKHSHWKCVHFLIYFASTTKLLKQGECLFQNINYKSEGKSGKSDQRHRR